MKDEGRRSKVEWLNQLPAATAAERFRDCCGSSRWVRDMVARRPYVSVAALLEAANAAWRALDPADWDEAFAHHPRIGEPRAAAPVSGTAAGWSRGEQAGAAVAEEPTRQALVEAQAEYERRFGRIYLVCATGRSAEELLADCRSRLGNDAATELQRAVHEQARIMTIRLRNSLTNG